MNLKKSLLVITGFADGLGVALASHYLSHDYHVIGLSRKPPSEKVMKQLGRHFTHYAVDLTQGKASMQVFDNIFNTYDTPKTLIHNTAQLVISPFAETSRDTFVSTWETIFLSAVISSQACLPMMEANSSGSIIFTGASASIRGSSQFSAFASSKFALRALAQSLAREYGPKGIHVIHTLIDGLVWSPQTIVRFDPHQEKCLLPKDIAETYFNLSQQAPSAWSHEIDLRPTGESF